MIIPKPISAKALHKSAMNTVVSTFAGCGGSSLGYKLADCKILLSVECNKAAIDTYQINFPETAVYAGKIEDLSVEECLKLIDLKAGELDILDGSPPCQGFSNCNMSKDKVRDPRNQLSFEFARLLKGLQPKAFVVENVSAMTHKKNRPLFDQIIQAFEDCGYTVRWWNLNASDYGVAQQRHRVIIIGIRQDLNIIPECPPPLGYQITFGEAVAGLTRTEQTPATEPTANLRQRYNETKPGSAHPVNFNVYRCGWDKPTQAVCRSGGWAGHYHPEECRKLNTAELKRITSLPDEFIFPGTYRTALNQIGNIVPPQFMRHIAKSLTRQLELKE